MKRRQFLKRSLAAAGGITLAPTFIPGTALGKNGAVAANERLVMGTIGLGGRGRYVMSALMDNADVQMVAVCEVSGERRANGKRMVDEHYGNSDCATYIDLREILARKDIDAMLIATGDNWHSMAAVMTARAGKDMYCEKPMSTRVAEGRAVVEAVRRYSRVFQCGTQRRSLSRFRFAADLARSGKLGKLTTLYAEKAPMSMVGGGLEIQERTLPPQPEPPREEFDWNLWLGPAQWRPYNKEYPTRRFWSTHVDFSGGAINEWGSHTVDLCQWANNADDSGPILYEPWKDTIIAHYKNGVKLIFESGVWPLHVKYVGTEGSVYVDDDGNLVTEPASLREGKDFGKGYPAENHVRNFLDCVKTREKPTSDVETAHRSVTVCHVANICRRLNRAVAWNPETEEFIGDEQANRMRSRAQRAPWII